MLIKGTAVVSGFLFYDRVGELGRLGELLGDPALGAPMPSATRCCSASLGGW